MLFYKHKEAVHAICHGRKREFRQQRLVWPAFPRGTRISGKIWAAWMFLPSSLTATMTAVTPLIKSGA